MKKVIFLIAVLFFPFVSAAAADSLQEATVFCAERVKTEEPPSAPAKAVAVCSEEQVIYWFQELKTVIAELKGYEAKWDDLEEEDKGAYLQGLKSSRINLDEQIHSIRNDLQSALGVRSGLKQENLLGGKVTRRRLQSNPCFCACDKKVECLDGKNWAVDVWSCYWDKSKGVSCGLDSYNRCCLCGLMNGFLLGTPAISSIPVAAFAGLSQGVAHGFAFIFGARANCKGAEYKTEYTIEGDFGQRVKALIPQLENLAITVRRIKKIDPEIVGTASVFLHESKMNSSEIMER